MLAIRFYRTGRKNYPSYKIVVTEKEKSSTGGRFVEEVGFFNPATKEKVLKPERLKYWIGVGAQPSPTVWNLLVQEKVVEGTKLPKHKKPKEKEEPKAGSVPASAAEVTPTKEAELQAEAAAPERGSASAPKEPEAVAEAEPLSSDDSSARGSASPEEPKS